MWGAELQFTELQCDAVEQQGVADKNAVSNSIAKLHCYYYYIVCLLRAIVKISDKENHLENVEPVSVCCMRVAVDVVEQNSCAPTANNSALDAQ